MANTAETVQQLYARWKARDLESVGVLLAEDFCYVIQVPQDIHPLGGACHGRDMALARLGAILDGFEIIEYAVGPLMIGGDHVATQPRAHYRDCATGEELEITMAHFWTLRDGKAVRLIEYHDIDTVRDFVARVANH